MRGTSFLGLALAASLGIAARGTAQAKEGGISVAVTPYVGGLIRTSDLLFRPSGGLSAGDLERIGPALAFGGRLGVGFSRLIGLEGDIGYSSGSLELSAFHSAVNTDVKTTNGSVKVVVSLVPKTAPLWLMVGAGVGATHHAFDDRSGGIGELQDKTSVGAVLGTSFGFRLGGRLSLVFSIDDYLYDASFDIVGTAATATTTSRRQNDVRAGVGIRVPLMGL